jgi:hypothetical protein
MSKYVSEEGGKTWDPPCGPGGNNDLKVGSGMASAETIYQHAGTNPEVTSDRSHGRKHPK